MKKLLLIISVALVAACTVTPEKRAQKLIKAHLKETMNDWGSYEPVKFGELDTVYSSPLEIEQYSEAFRKQFDYEIESKYAALDKAQAYKDSLAYYTNIVDSIKKCYVPHIIGWRMTHTSRGSNALGNKIISTSVFYFDADLTEVIDVEDEDE